MFKLHVNLSRQLNFSWWILSGVRRRPSSSIRRLGAVSWREDGLLVSLAGHGGGGGGHGGKPLDFSWPDRPWRRGGGRCHAAGLLSCADGAVLVVAASLSLSLASPHGGGWLAGVACWWRRLRLGALLRCFWRRTEW